MTKAKTIEVKSCSICPFYNETFAASYCLSGSEYIRREKYYIPIDEDMRKDSANKLFKACPLKTQPITVKIKK